MLKTGETALKKEEKGFIITGVNNFFHFYSSEEKHLFLVSRIYIIIEVKKFLFF
jgi:hypothetical protein